MSYVNAPTFEANEIGVRRLYTLSGLGDASDDTVQNMINDGYDPGMVQTLQDTGATDAQLQDLYDNYGAGTPEFASAASILMGQLTGLQAAPGQPATSVPGSPLTAANMQTSSTASLLSPLLPTTTAAPTPPASTPPSSSGMVPAGSIFTYTVQWATSLLNVSGPSQILAAVNSVLQQNSINIINSSVPSTIVGQATGFTIVIQTNAAFGQVADIKSVCDGAVAQAGRQVVSSVLVSGGSAMAGTISAPAGLSTAGLSTWFAQNWITVAALVFAAAIAPAVIRRL